MFWELVIEEKHDPKGTYKEFKHVVNMTASALEKRFKSEESQSVVQKRDGGEATSHGEGRRIVEMLHKKKSDLTDDDCGHMHKVVGYVHRHLKQGGPQEKDTEEESP